MHKIKKIGYHFLGIDVPNGEICLKSLFHEYYDRLVYFSVQLTKDNEQAQDIAQEAFIKYWDNRERISTDPIAIKNYLYNTVKNLSLNALRHNKIVDHYVLQQQAYEPIDQPIIDSIIASELLAEIHNAIQSLPENYRVISVKSFFEGKKNQEIADELGMSINTVKKQKQKTIQLLRLKLNSEALALLLLILQ
jgi:RNA polymerase sigma-70 factor (family 1)